MAAGSAAMQDFRSRVLPAENNDAGRFISDDIPLCAGGRGLGGVNRLVFPRAQQIADARRDTGTVDRLRHPAYHLLV
ncbi:hypothetical protein BDD41_3330 [Paracoccus versutus]|uniref:Uncharacterized protein n=2 Tax=Paracoccus versutus TaxID=34007 RepID=A0A3D9XF83_PARVE|nr:hypothetical protein [Paracoccus sp. FO-3]REF68291.1 hypothetical protein BDD41_3330 [Paracoccus versutus]SFY25285.1 hypothetical protein SAMN04244548_03258 [Paracoccus pantotrophus]